MPFFQNVFRPKDTGPKSKKAAANANGRAVDPPRPRWEDAWNRKEIAPEEIQELIHQCTHEMKSRVLDTPFLLLPFRPGTDASSSRIFVGKFFKAKYEGSGLYNGLGLEQELRLTEPMVLCSIMKWCWSRLPGGVVTWDAYEMFKMGEQDSRMARHAFDTFIPLAVDSKARTQIIFDFFDLLAAIAARGKNNGLGGRKLSRMAGWWAFEHSDQGSGFDGGYKSWSLAADATSHLFFAYLRSLSPESVAGANGISQIPRSLQALLSQTEYPPERPQLMFTSTSKVVMIVDAVSPTPFALLRRTRHFEYRDDDLALQSFSQHEDPVRALTDECRRVLNSISRTNQSSIMTNGSGKPPDPSWSRFEDMGFSEFDSNRSSGPERTGSGALKANSQSRNTDFGRPTTPSWADFLSSGFAADGTNGASTPMLLPPDKILPPIGEGRGHSSQSHVRNGTGDTGLEPGELASINRFELDETFWWVWMTSLASEEPAERKAVFGRCALIETNISGGRWLVIEEQIKGSSPGPEDGAYIAEKKSRFSFRRNKSSRTRTQSTSKRTQPTGKRTQSTAKDSHNRTATSTPYSRNTIGADQQAKIQAAAQQLVEQQEGPKLRVPYREAADDEPRRQSTLTVGPTIINEASQAMKWARQYDRKDIHERYMGDAMAGTGRSMEHLGTFRISGATTSTNERSSRELPSLPPDGHRVVSSNSSERSSLPQSPLPPMPPKENITPAPQELHVPMPIADEKPLLAGNPVLPDVSRDEPRQMAPSVPVSSVESVKDARKRLKRDKSGGPGGLKKLFTIRGKENRISRAFTTQPLSEEPGRTETPDLVVPVAPPAPRVVPVEHHEPEPLVSAPLADDGDVTSELSPAHTIEEAGAAHDFGRFDQGPLDDVPAFLSQESPEMPDESADSAPAPPSFGREPSRMSRKAAPTWPASPTGPSPAPVSAIAESAKDSDDAKASPMEDEISAPTSIPNANDRWAQIRRNAAERAQRMSGDHQSGPSVSHSLGGRSVAPSAGGKSVATGTTDDGDTSGEETIESRVARIKARVAELTGNMDSSSSASGGRW